MSFLILLNIQFISFIEKPFLFLVTRFIIHFLSEHQFYVFNMYFRIIESTNYVSKTQSYVPRL